MGKKEEVLRAYKMSDGSMIQLADRVISTAGRDSTELIPEGVTEARLDALQQKIDDYNDMEDDEEWQGLVSIKVASKNGFLDLCETEVRNMRRRAKNIFGETSPDYGRFAFEGINKLAEASRIKAYRRIWRRGTAALDDLDSEGLTTAILDNFKVQIDNADHARDVVEDTEEDRDIATDARNTLGNEIFAEVVKICETGKDYWFDKNEAKYNDYVINDVAESSNIVKVQLILAAGGVGNYVFPAGIDFDTIVSLLFEARHAAGNFGAVEAVNDTPGPTIIAVAADASVSKTSEEAGTELGASETRTFINVKNMGLVTGTYIITITKA